MNFPKKQPLESTKWLKYRFNRKEDNIEDNENKEEIKIEDVIDEKGDLI